MFTGIVQQTGQITNIEKTGEGKRITIKSNKFFEDSETGNSINVSGTCLTIEEIHSENKAKFFLAEETLELTWFKNILVDDKVNLEQSLTPKDKMGGHIVQGHIEDAVKIKEIESLEEGWNITFEKPKDLDKYIVHKGFIAIEGISLTITEDNKDSFSVTIIPETWKVTNLSEKEEGDLVNIETDMMGKYVEKMMNNK